MLMGVPRRAGYRCGLMHDDHVDFGASRGHKALHATLNAGVTQQSRCTEARGVIVGPFVRSVRVIYIVIRPL
jgi:hypothetical protein